LLHETDESEDTTVTEEADFSRILKGAEVELASYTYASDDWWLAVSSVEEGEVEGGGGEDAPDL
jgi:hypothetical protein